MSYFFSDPDHLSHLPKGTDYRNILIHCKEYLRLVRLELLDRWADNTPEARENFSFDFWTGPDSLGKVPLFKEIEDLCGKIGEHVGGEDQFKGLHPDLHFDRVDPCLFGDCTGLYGEINPRLIGDVSGLKGELSSELHGRISPLLKGDVTGLKGRLDHLEGELNKDLVGYVTGVDGHINPGLTGDISGMIGIIDPGLKGDCTGLTGTVTGLTGDCTGLSGRCSLLTGDCTGLTGDCTGISGDCTGLTGNLSEIPWDLRPNYLSNFSNLFSS